MKQINEKYPKRKKEERKKEEEKNKRLVGGEKILNQIKEKKNFWLHKNEWENGQKKEEDEMVANKFFI